MTDQQLLSSIQTLPPQDQFELANSILDSLAAAGKWPLSDEMKRVLDTRAKNADEHPDKLIPSETVFAELRSKLKSV